METLSIDQVSWDDLSDGKLGIAQSVINSMDSGTIRFLKFKPGAMYPMHHHPDRFEWVYVVEGSMETEIEGEKSIMKKGEFRSFPVMVKHSLKAGKNGSTVIICSLICRNRRPSEQ